MSLLLMLFAIMDFGCCWFRCLIHHAIAVLYLIIYILKYEHVFIILYERNYIYIRQMFNVSPLEP